MTQKPTQRRVISEAEFEEEEVKYRLRQFYMILLTADKARLLSLEKGESANKSDEKMIKPE